MIDQQARVHSIVKGKLKQVALSRNSLVGCLVVYGTVLCPPADNPHGESKLQTGWHVMVTMRSPIVGESDVGASIPIPGVMPPDVVFEQATEYLFGEVYKLWEKRKQTPQMVGKDLSELKLGK